MYFLNIFAGDMRINKWLAFFICIAFWSSCARQDILNDQLIRVSYNSIIENKERDFYLYLPNGYAENSEKEWPVLLFLHGNGERGDGKNDLDFVLMHGPLYEAWVQKRNLPFIIISPQLPMFDMDIKGPAYIRNRKRSQIPKRLADAIPEREAEFKTQGPVKGIAAHEKFDTLATDRESGWSLVLDDLILILDNVLDNYRADEKKVYLSGLSYGGFGTWHLASKYPERFAAIAPVAGWGHPDLMAPIAEHKVPVWAFAGGRDHNVLKERFYDGLNTLETMGHSEVLFTVHEDRQHDVWKRVYAGEDLYSWLLKHSLP